MGPSSRRRPGPRLNKALDSGPGSKHSGAGPRRNDVWLVIAALAFFVADDVYARSRAPVRAFVDAVPCPSTGVAGGKCPGYVVDHVVPLCAGGADDPANMQWQARADSYAKDRAELALCRWIRRAKKP